MSVRVTGIVKWFNITKGYGYISIDGSEDLFVHYSSIVGVGYYSFFEKGQKVEFSIQKGRYGSQAQDVVALSN